MASEVITTREELLFQLAVACELEHRRAIGAVSEQFDLQDGGSPTTL